MWAVGARRLDRGRVRWGWFGGERGAVGRTGGGRLCWCVRACSEPSSEAKRWAPRGSLVAARRFSRESGCLFPRTIIHTAASLSSSLPRYRPPRFLPASPRLVALRDFYCVHAAKLTHFYGRLWNSAPARTHTTVGRQILSSSFDRVGSRGEPSGCRVIKVGVPVVSSAVKELSRGRGEHVGSRRGCCETGRKISTRRSSIERCRDYEWSRMTLCVIRISLIWGPQVTRVCKFARWNFSYFCVKSAYC